MLRRALAAVLAGVVAGPVALAAEPGEPIALDFRATSDCPDAATFEMMVRGRTARARFVTSGQTRTFAVALTGGAHPSGSLTVERGGATEGVREVHADTCAEGAEALALMVALAVDPAAMLGPVGTTGAVSPPAPSRVESSATPTSTGPSPTPMQPSAAPLPVPTAARAPVESTPVTRTTPPPHTLFVGTDLVVSGGVPASPLLGVAPFLGWRFPSRGFIAPSLRASFLREGSSAAAATGGSASFTWTLGRLEGCVVGWPPGPAHLLACARVEAGVLEANGNGIAGSRSSEQGWVALGPVARGEWELLRPLFLAIDAAPMVRLTTERFYFLPNTTLYQPSTVGLEASAGLGVHFL